jgi:pimeloyl-ACP methyl ester carboxylesterase
MNNLPAFVALLVMPLLAGGCAFAPAKIARVIKAMPIADEHALLASALNEPESSQGKLALAHFIEHWKLAGRGATVDIPPAKKGSGVTYRVTFAGMPWGAYPIDYFDQIGAAADFEVSPLKHNMRTGFGAPLTALRENQQRQALERYFPDEAITRPLTAIATKGEAHGRVQSVRIQLLCPLANSTVKYNGTTRPLAADFSVPWGMLLARSGKLNQARVLDLLTSTPRRKPQLYMMEPYDPNKEPLIMIHGLLSTPLTFADMSNELWADDAIRQRYQIWHYLYNTSAPALYSARLLRTQLRDLRALLDPSGKDPAMKKTTLLTHSMGGLVGKALAVQPGDRFWKAAFTVPHEQLKLDSADRQLLNDAFEWQRDPTIHRIIFVTVPHRGSDFADNLIGRIGHWITAPPQTFHAFYQRISEANPDVFTPDYAELGSGKLDSIHSLSPKQPTLHILAALPLAPGVKVHSIIADRGKSGPLEQSSDGVVPYRSSHIEDAASEKIVHCGHGALRDADTIAEIRRILKL